MHAITPHLKAPFPAAIKTLAGRLTRSLTAIRSFPGLRLEIAGQGYSDVLLRGEPFAEETADKVVRLPIDGNPDFAVLLSGPAGPVLELAETAARAQLGQLAIEQREELLLDELGANWESLEVLYEISTDVLRFGDVKTALNRLLERFTSLQSGLHACLMLGRQGKLECIAANAAVRLHLDWSGLGPIETPIRECRSTVVLHAVEWAAEDAWHGASMVAAAPLTSRREKVIGLVLVWRDDKQFVFDAPFSRLLEAIAYQASMLLECDRVNRTMRENERLAQEIEIASSIQQTLLMGNPPIGIPMVQIAASSAASQKIDGDFHDFLRHGAAVDIIIGDVMGKGVAAALLGAATKNQFLRAIANLSLQGSTPSPVEIVRRAASRLSERLIAVERFVTLCYARFDPRRSVLEFVDCGHTGILLHRKRSRETRYLRGNDLPLGVSPSLEFEQCTADIMPGDTFLLFSDGVTETKNPDHELFGDDRLIEALETWSSMGPTVVVQQIGKIAAEFRKSEPQSDDFTCVALRIVPDVSNEIPSRSEARFLCDLGQLEDVRNWLLEIATAGGVEPERLERLKIATQEAFVNCIRHGSEGGCLHPVFIEGELFSTHLRIRIRHRGPAFDPLAVPPPSFDGSRDGGFGTFIIMRSADELEYLREDGTNIISLSVFREEQ